MNILDTIAPNSDQLNADDLFAQPRVFTIERVAVAGNEQPVNVHLVESPRRQYRPSKSMRRVLVAAWGLNTDEWVGRKLMLYRDPDVKFGGQPVGGIKISHLSHIPGSMQIPLTVTRGKKAPHHVDVLAADAEPTSEPMPPSAEDVQACTDKAELGRMWKAAGPEMRQIIEARVKELDGGDVS